jgi:uncharacterized protein
MAGSDDQLNVVDDTARSRFAATVDSEVAVSGYRLNGDTITFTGTVVPESLRGRGVGEALARAGLDSARARNLRVVPACDFVAAFIRKHPEYQDLVADKG